jgi:hypothetical protein
MIGCFEESGGDAMRDRAPTDRAPAGADAELFRDVYEFASSAGAFEGYVYARVELDATGLQAWARNLAKQYESLPFEVRELFQGSLDRTIGRAIHSLTAVLGRDHETLRVLRSLVKGDLPESAQDFEKEKAEKAERYSP